MIILLTVYIYLFLFLQPSECPICSWINQPSKLLPTSFESFRKHKKSKGIIYYDDRILEISSNPSLISLSESLSPNNTTFTTPNNNNDNDNNCNSMNDNDNNNDNNINIKIEKQGLKRSTSQRGSRKRLRIESQ